MSIVPANKEHRLRTLMLLLSSDKDGEVVASARAIGKMLSAEGSSWHDLAGMVSGKSVATKSEPPVINKDKAKRYTTDAQVFHDLLDEELTAWEADFVRSVYNQWKRRASFSEKQSQTLRDIIERVKRRKAR